MFNFYEYSDIIYYSTFMLYLRSIMVNLYLWYSNVQKPECLSRFVAGPDVFAIRGGTSRRAVLYISLGQLPRDGVLIMGHQ